MNIDSVAHSITEIINNFSFQAPNANLQQQTDLSDRMKERLRSLAVFAIITAIIALLTGLSGSLVCLNIPQEYQLFLWLLWPMFIAFSMIFIVVVTTLIGATTSRRIEAYEDDKRERKFSFLGIPLMYVSSGTPTISGITVISVLAGLFLGGTIMTQTIPSQIAVNNITPTPVITPTITFTPLPTESPILIPTLTPTIQPSPNLAISNTPLQQPTTTPTDNTIGEPTPTAKLTATSTVVRPAVTTSSVILKPTRTLDPPVDASQEKSFFNFINEHRPENNCPYLSYSPELNAAARRHAIDMARNGLLQHEGTDGSDINTRVRESGYTNYKRGVGTSGWWKQLISRTSADQSSAAVPVDGWMSNPADLNRADILDCEYRDLGVGYAKGTDGQHYWVALLADGIPLN